MQHCFSLGDEGCARIRTISKSPLFLSATLWGGFTPPSSLPCVAAAFCLSARPGRRAPFPHTLSEHPKQIPSPSHWNLPHPSAKISASATRGRVAQLGERLVRNEEVAGSIPVSSTKIINENGTSEKSLRASLRSF